MGTNPSHKQASARKVILTGASINLTLAVLKLTTGWMFGSRALIADGIDSTSDLLTDFIALLAYPIARKPADDTHPYGHGRIESLTSIIVALFLIGAGTTIAYNGISTIIAGNVTAPEKYALFIALVVLVSKELLYRWTKKVATRLNSKILHANAWNHRGDAFSSIAVTIGITASIFIPGAASLDAWASLVVVIFILRAAITIALKGAHDLLDTSQDPELLKRVKQIALENEDVYNVHRERSRRYGHLIYVDLDIEVENNKTVEEGHTISHDVKNAILEKCTSIADVQIHVEPIDDHLEGEGPVRLQ